MSDTNLRQSVADARATGVLSELNLEMTKDNKGQDIIRGNVVIKTDETNSVSYRVYTNRLTTKGEKNPAWDGLVTVMNTFNSIAKVGEQNATKVHVNGQYAPSTFMGKDGSLREGVPQYRASFFSEVRNLDNYKPHAELTLEIFIRALTREVARNGEETGRVLVKGWVSLYNGLEPVTLVAPKDIAETIMNTFEVGQTAMFYADIVNSAYTVEIPVAIGKPRTETRFVNELLISGATMPYNNDSAKEKDAFDAEAIKNAVNVYNERVNDMRSGTGQKEVKKAAPAAQVPLW